MRPSTLEYVDARGLPMWVRPVQGILGWLRLRAKLMLMGAMLVLPLMAVLGLQVQQRWREWNAAAMAERGANVARAIGDAILAKRTHLGLTHWLLGGASVASERDVGADRHGGGDHRAGVRSDFASVRRSWPRRATACPRRTARPVLLPRAI